MRILKWLFGVCDHGWSKYETQGEIVIMPSKRVVGYWQQRQCSKCGALDIRKVW